MADMSLINCQAPHCPFEAQGFLMRFDRPGCPIASCPAGATGKCPDVYYGPKDDRHGMKTCVANGANHIDTWVIFCPNSKDFENL